MQDFNNSEKDPVYGGTPLTPDVDFLKLSELCLDICNDKVVKLGDWTSRDIDLFVSQFKEAELEPEIDMDKLDPKPYPRSYFEEKFPGFDENVITALYECENTKLQDMRMAPLRVLRDKVGTLAIENPTKEYNASQEKNQEAQEQEAQEQETEGEGQSESETGSYRADRARWFQKANEEEED